MVVLGGTGMGLVLIIYLSGRIGKPGFLQFAALHADQEGYVSVPTQPSTLVGRAGVASTDLRPSGMVDVDGDFYDAISLKGFIDKGDAVEVKRYENFQLYVVRKTGKR